jgi:hypothetical protein
MTTAAAPAADGERGLRGPLLVLGATGSLGGALCAAAPRVLPGVRVLRASRRPPPGEGWRRADLRDEASLRAALAGVAVAIDAAGPYDYDPSPLLRAAGAAGCALIDLADRAGYLEAVEAAADPATVARLTGCAVVPGLAEAVGAALARDPAVRALRVWWSVGSRKRVSGALLYALLRPLGRRVSGGGAPGPLVARGVHGTRFWFGRHAWPRGGGARVAGRRLPVEVRVGMDRRLQARALQALAPLTGALPDALLLRACRALQPATRFVTALGGEAGCLVVEALDERGGARASVEILAPRGLDLAALPALWAARALLAAQPAPRGCVALAELADARALAAWMRAEGWILTGLG